MEVISHIFSEFLAKMKNEILEYYKLTYSYLKDLITYKNIDLRINTLSESEEIKKKTLEKILKAIKTGLNTIGVPIIKLNEIQNNFMKLVSTKSNEIQDYNSYLKLYQRNFINKILFETLFDYLLDIDTKKVENLKLFDLLPLNFLEKLNNFKEKNLKSSYIKKIFLQHDFDNYINYSNLTLKIKTSKTIQKDKIIHTIKLTETTKQSEKRKEPEQDILAQLRKAKEDIIETLKIPKNGLLTPLTIKLKRNSSPLEKIIQTNTTIQRVHPQVGSHGNKVVRFPPKDFPTKKEEENFLDSFGNFSPIHPDLINRFKIDKVSLLNSRVNNLDFMDLENLFYYISNLRMLDLDLPFNNIEILEIVKNYMNGNIFSSSKNNIPDIKSIFYGLTIFSELNLWDNTNVIDVSRIEKFIKLNLKNFIPEKLEVNVYSLLCLKVMEKNDLLIMDMDFPLNLVLNLKLSNLEEYSPIQDVYNHLTVIRLFNKRADIIELKRKYLNEIKKFTTSIGSINNIITESAKALLIIDLLSLKEEEPDLCSGLLNFIINSTTFFNLINLNEDFNWRNNQLGYKIELKMLFWALLACSQYAPRKA